MGKKNAANIAQQVHQNGDVVDLRRLTRVCRKHVLSADHSAVVPEPYLPFVPPQWNGVLVTAEAQNLSRRNATYRTWLLQQEERARIRRLYDYGEVGVTPWTDGTLQLAVEAALDVRAEQTAVSNAVPWSIVDDGDRNSNPTSVLIERAQMFWADIFTILRPSVLVACGAVGREVFTPLVQKIRPCELYLIRLPSNRLLSQVSGMFCDEDLLSRYHEVANAADRHSASLDKNRRNKLFFACHAVSVISRGGLVAPPPRQHIPDRRISKK